MNMVVVINVQFYLSFFGRNKAENYLSTRPPLNSPKWTFSNSYESTQIQLVLHWLWARFSSTFSREEDREVRTKILNFGGVIFSFKKLGNYPKYLKPIVWWSI